MFNPYAAALALHEQALLPSEPLEKSATSYLLGGWRWVPAWVPGRGLVLQKAGRRSRKPSPGQMSLFAPDDAPKQGATKVVNGVSYRFNENSRWERADKQRSAATAKPKQKLAVIEDDGAAAVGVDRSVPRKNVLANYTEMHSPQMAMDLRNQARNWAKSDDAQNISDRAGYIVGDLLGKDFGKLFGDVDRGRQTLDDVRGVFDAMRENGYLSDRDADQILGRIDSFKPIDNGPATVRPAAPVDPGFAIPPPPEPKESGQDRIDRLNAEAIAAKNTLMKEQDEFFIMNNHGEGAITVGIKGMGSARSKDPEFMEAATMAAELDGEAFEDAVSLLLDKSKSSAEQLAEVQAMVDSDAAEMDDADAYDAMMRQRGRDVNDRMNLKNPDRLMVGEAWGVKLPDGIAVHGMSGGVLYDVQANQRVSEDDGIPSSADEFHDFLMEKYPKTFDGLVVGGRDAENWERAMTEKIDNKSVLGALVDLKFNGGGLAKLERMEAIAGTPNGPSNYALLSVLADNPQAAAEVMNAGDEGAIAPEVLQPRKLSSRKDRNERFDAIRENLQDAARGTARAAGTAQDFYEQSLEAIADGLGEDVGQGGGNRAAVDAALESNPDVLRDDGALKPARRGMRTRAEREAMAEHTQQTIRDAAESTVGAAQTFSEMSDTAAAAVADAYGMGDEAEDELALPPGNAGAIAPTPEPSSSAPHEPGYQGNLTPGKIEYIAQDPKDGTHQISIDGDRYSYKVGPKGASSFRHIDGDGKVIARNYKSFRDKLGIPKGGPLSTKLVRVTNPGLLNKSASVFRLGTDRYTLHNGSLIKVG